MPHLLDNEQLKTLIAIAESGSFTRAADEVHKTQAAVSQQMRRLEDTVGRPLFARVGRHNRLTGDGEQLLQYARRIIHLNNEVLMTFNEPELAGHVRIGTPDDYAERFLPPIFARFSRTHPNVEVEVSCVSSSALGERVTAGEVDLAIVTHGDSVTNGDVIRRERLYWISSPSHATHEADIVPLALGPSCCTWRAAATASLDKRKRAYRVAYSSPSGTALAAAVSSGLAVAIMPESSVRPDMRILTETDGFPDLIHCDIALLRAQGREEQPAHVRALEDHVIESLSNLDWGPGWS